MLKDQEQYEHVEHDEVMAIGDVHNVATVGLKKQDIVSEEVCSIFLVIKDQNFRIPTTLY